MHIRLSTIVLIFICCLSTSVMAAESQDQVPRSQPLKAYMNLYFGDSKAIVEAKLKDSIGDSCSYPSVYCSVQMYDVDYTISAYYFTDRLYRLVFRSPFYTASYFDTRVKMQRDNLVALIKAQYGEASEEHNVGFLNMQSGYIAYTHIWNNTATGYDKQISIGFGDRDSEYYAAMVIEYLPLVKAKKQADEEAKKAEIESKKSLF